MVRCKYEHDRYYKRGIKNFLTPEDLKLLWFRDKAYLMKKPSIDRINDDGNYTLKNCRYLELIININRGKAKQWGYKYEDCTGKWHLFYDKCKLCGRHDVPYEGKGYCTKCYMVMYKKRNREYLNIYKKLWARKKAKKLKEVSK